MKKVGWCLIGAMVGLVASTAAHAGESSFIQRPTRIKGCVAIVEEVKNGHIAPTEWLEQNKEEFKDLELELKARKYTPSDARNMMMGMAISICMERKGYVNKCAVSRGEDGDVQMMATAAIYACWTRNDRSEAPLPREEVVTPPPPSWPPLPPPMSPADLAQFNEDAGFLRQPVHFIGDDENGAKESRFGSCASYWQSLHHNRPPQVRQVLYAVRVARCMFRTNFAVLPVRCPPAFASMLQPSCYARFG